MSSPAHAESVCSSPEGTAEVSPTAVLSAVVRVSTKFWGSGFAGESSVQAAMPERANRSSRAEQHDLPPPYNIS